MTTLLDPCRSATATNKNLSQVVGEMHEEMNGETLLILADWCNPRFLFGSSRLVIS